MLPGPVGPIRVGTPPPIGAGTAPTRPAGSGRALPDPVASSDTAVARLPAATTTPAASSAFRRRGSVETRPISVSWAIQEPPPRGERATEPHRGQTMPGSGPMCSPPQCWHLMAAHHASAARPEGEFPHYWRSSSGHGVPGWNWYGPARR